MIFLIIYWLFFLISCVALLGCISASTAMGLRFREATQNSSQSEPVSSLSMIVPLKGADDFTLNRSIFSIAGLRNLIFLPAYELIAVPILFGKGFFQRTIEWRGRRYRLGRHGFIQAMTE